MAKEKLWFRFSVGDGQALCVEGADGDDVPAGEKKH